MKLIIIRVNVIWFYLLKDVWLYNTS